MLASNVVTCAFISCADHIPTGGLTPAVLQARVIPKLPPTERSRLIE